MIAPEKPIFQITLENFAQRQASVYFSYEGELNGSYLKGNDHKEPYIKIVPKTKIRTPKAGSDLIVGKCVEKDAQVTSDGAYQQSD